MRFSAHEDVPSSSLIVDDCPTFNEWTKVQSKKETEGRKDRGIDGSVKEEFVRLDGIGASEW